MPRREFTAKGRQERISICQHVLRPLLNFNFNFFFFFKPPRSKKSYTQNEKRNRGPGKATDRAEGMVDRPYVTPSLPSMKKASTRLLQPSGYRDAGACAAATVSFTTTTTTTPPFFFPAGAPEMMVLASACRCDRQKAESFFVFACQIL